MGQISELITNKYTQISGNNSKFNIGDKVVCIDNNGWDNYFSINKILTVKNIDRVYVEFEEVNGIYVNIRFISTNYYRKLKLQKISKYNG